MADRSSEAGGAEGDAHVCVLPGAPADANQERVTTGGEAPRFFVVRVSVSVSFLDS